MLGCLDNVLVGWLMAWDGIGTAWLVALCVGIFLWDESIVKYVASIIFVKTLREYHKQSDSQRTVPNQLPL
jgi:hypothetical protein